MERETSSHDEERHSKRQRSRSCSRDWQRSGMRDRGSSKRERHRRAPSPRQDYHDDRSSSKRKEGSEGRAHSPNSRNQARSSCSLGRWSKDAEGFWSMRLKSVSDNPHLHALAQEELVVKHEEEFSRVLASNAPRLPYRRRRGECKSTVHWGQRKLLLSEIEFLTLYSDPSSTEVTVVYAGAAPGTHIPYLADLFPYLKFVLVDPSDFSCAKHDRVQVRQEYFTHEVAKEFVGKKTLFISDIRTAQWRHMKSEEIEAAIAQDMSWQREWHKIMRPLAGMHKFRLPWAAGQTEYLDGQVYLPIWGPQTTSEARLVVVATDPAQAPATKMWDNTAYEEQMFYFNTVTRLTAYDHDVELREEGIDHCYDCAAEIQVLRRYLTRHRHVWQHKQREGDQGDEGELSRDVVREETRRMTSRISRECSKSGRTLRTFLSAPDDRVKGPWFKSQKFDTDAQKVVQIDHNASNLEKAQRDSWHGVMRESLRKGKPAGGDGTDPATAMWTDLGEPNLGDVAYSEARRGVGGALGDEVPSHTFLYSWVLSVLTGLVLGQQEAEALRGVQVFKEERVLPSVRSMLRCLIAQHSRCFMARLAMEGPQASSSRTDALVLSCRSGTVYLVHGVVRGAKYDDHGKVQVTRLTLPLPDQEFDPAKPPAFHHLTVLRAVLLMADSGGGAAARQTSLTLLDLWAVQGASTANLSQGERWDVMETGVKGPVMAHINTFKDAYKRAGIQILTFAGRESAEEEVPNDHGLVFVDE